MAEFRNKYLAYAEMTSLLEGWARTHPDLLRLVSIGRSSEGRELWLLRVGRDPDATRPAAWVDGNMHAMELCGSNVALAIAEDVIALHRGTPTQALPAKVAEALRDVHFYVMPRMSPDGAEAVLQSGRYVRSSPEDTRKHKGHAYWRSKDLDGDGRVRTMRCRCDDGELCTLPGYPDVLVPRLPEDDGPFYRVFPEGVIENFDGRRLPDPYFLSDNQHDFNRNFPWSWAPEPEQVGAGDFPGCTPETRAVLTFTAQHPNIFAWLNLHTFGGVLIRPLGHAPDTKLDMGDLAIYRQVEQWMKELTGYPTVSGYHEFLYEPEKPIRGDLTDYAFHQRGALAYAVELWDLFRRIGMDVKKPFVDHYAHLTRKDHESLVKFDREHNEGRVFMPWRPFVHPQLGEVEIGGPEPLVGVSNPPYKLIDETCRAQSAAYLRVAALLPRVDARMVARETIAPDLTRFDVRVANSGYLPTFGIAAARKLPHAEPLRIEARTVGGARLQAPAESIVELGHLEGWGQGLYNGSSIFLPWSRGNASERIVSLVIQGHGSLTVRVGSCRVGHKELSMDC